MKLMASTAVKAMAKKQNMQQQPTSAVPEAIIELNVAVDMQLEAPVQGGSSQGSYMYHANRARGGVGTCSHQGQVRTVQSCSASSQKQCLQTLLQEPFEEPIDLHKDPVAVWSRTVS